jgi:HSP20 family protein
MGRGFDDEKADSELLHLLGLRERMKRLFDEHVPADTGDRSSAPLGWTPAVDIMDAGDKFVLTAEIPGVAEEDIDLKLIGDSLVLRGERSPDPNEKILCYHRIERHEGIFQRVFRLPCEVDAEGILAVCRDGVLRVEIPKLVPCSSEEVSVRVEG